MDQDRNGNNNEELRRRNLYFAYAWTQAMYNYTYWSYEYYYHNNPNFTYQSVFPPAPPHGRAIAFSGGIPPMAQYSPAFAAAASNYYGNQMNFGADGFLHHYQAGVVDPQHLLYSTAYGQHILNDYYARDMEIVNLLMASGAAPQEALRVVDFGWDDITYEVIMRLQEQMGNVNTGLREEDIVINLERSIYKITAASPETCCICLEEFVNGASIGNINCMHKFHFDCIVNWLKTKNSCPTCRGQALTIT